MNDEYKQITSMVLTGERHNYAAIDQQLADELSLVNEMCERAGGRLRSRQVIAAIILDWEIRTGLNPISEE